MNDLIKKKHKVYIEIEEGDVLVRRTANSWVAEHISLTDPDRISIIEYQDNPFSIYRQKHSLCALIEDNFPTHMRSKRYGGIVLKVEENGWNKGVPLADTLEKIEYY